MEHLFRKTCFRTDLLPEQWPEQFSIITAYAPTGFIWKPEQNHWANQNLWKELSRLGCWTHPITGFDPDSDHQEPGWAAALDLQTARRLGRQFHQVAIFYIQNDELFLSNCDPDSLALTPIGQFRSRIQISTP